MRTGKYSFTKKHCIRLRIHMADQCTEFDVSSVSRCGDITWGVKF